jgi:hypothetical protein
MRSPQTTTSYLGRPPFLDSSGFDVRRFSDPAAALTGEHNIV